MRSHFYVPEPPDVHIHRNPADVHRQLIAFARKNLRNDAWAEDAVSEAILAALDRPQMFKGQAHTNTWLIGILKHKLADQIRQHCLSDEDEECERASRVDRREPFTETSDDFDCPHEQLERRELFDAVLKSSRALPYLQRHAFLLRHWHDLDTSEVCDALDVTPSYLFVLLHRARLHVRASVTDAH